MPRTNLLEDNIWSTLFRMTVPMMMGIVSLMLFNLADLYFVSRLGTESLAALGFTFPVCFTVISLAIGLGVGMSATLARLLGSGDSTGASSLASDTLLAIAVMVALISLLLQFLLDPVFSIMGAGDNLMPIIKSYMNIWLLGSVFLVVNMVCNACMRATGDTKTPALLMAGSSLLNFVLDPLLIFGFGPVPGLGIEGAASASIIAWFIATLVALHILYHNKKLIVIQTVNWLRIRGHFTAVMKIGLPAALSNMMTPVAQAVLTFLVAKHGPEAVAAFGVGSRIESLSLLVCLALSMTLPPFISQNFGAGNISRVKAAYKWVVGFAVLWQGLVFLMLLLVADSIAGLFSDTDAVKTFIVLWIFIVPLGFAFQAVTFLTASSFNALHQPMRAMRISLVRLFVFSLPLSWLGSQLAGIQGMFAALVIANLLVSITAWLAMQRFLRTL
ncbi:MAG: MATE family efflux transporter [Neptuniibacter caesariensis]|uniref:MATE family efflux transporter n=1 Tax=Neptuniibacter caesariensis TaxID=207954 RepID=A0A2G6JPC7_NEPCE|nr:MAG: MATE family efflux transporter [Neptuniibacter caesariensis]